NAVDGVVGLELAVGGGVRDMLHTDDDVHGVWEATVDIGPDRTGVSVTYLTPGRFGPPNGLSSGR
ncbi:hypothetical protein, partial [Nocardioides sp.]|uniref:hypothetical protein n=1 Tax=Nocardioides sp. TaxID=35761 RepID=UPI0035690630